MAETGRLTACQIEKDPCKRDAQAVCLHCSKSFCRSHFAQHLRVIEIEAIAELSALSDRFNDTIAKFDQISVSPNVTDKPFADLNQWAAGAHRVIDDMVREKQQELKQKIQAYNDDLAVNKRKQLEIIDQKKTTLATLIAEGEPTASDKAEIEKTLEEAEKYFESIQTHRIEINATKPMVFFDIRTETSEQKLMRQRSKRKFEVTYVRLDGTIRKYSVLSMKDGTMKDLIRDFIRKYNLSEEACQMDNYFSFEVDNHRPKPDCIFPVEIYNFRIHTQYKTDQALSSVDTKDIIVFYEIPYSLELAESPQILMPCYFHRDANDDNFRFPLYLSVPRNECTGRDILMALHGTLQNFFQINSAADLDLPTPTLSFTMLNTYSTLTKSLNSCLDEIIDFNKANTSLEVKTDKQIFVKRDDQSNLNGFYESLSFAVK